MKKNRNQRDLYNLGREWGETTEERVEKTPTAQHVVGLGGSEGRRGAREDRAASVEGQRWAIQRGRRGRGARWDRSGAIWMVGVVVVVGSIEKAD